MLMLGSLHWCWAQLATRPNQHHQMYMCFYQSQTKQRQNLTSSSSHQDCSEPPSLSRLCYMARACNRTTFQLDPTTYHLDQHAWPKGRRVAWSSPGDSAALSSCRSGLASLKQLNKTNTFLFFFHIWVRKVFTDIFASMPGTHGTR